jgi:hypothetical protein
MELVRQKNVATYIVFPIVDADGDFVSGATGLDSEIDAWADGSAPDGFSDCTNEATEIGSTGVYYLSLTQSEMNNDYIVVQVKTTSSGAKTQLILLRTMVGDPLNIGTHTSGRELGVESDGDLVKVNTLDGHTAQTGDAYARLGAPAGASVSADIAAIKSETATIVADTNELQTDLTDGGRLDLLIDSILEDTGTTLPGTLSTLAGYLDTEIAAILEDTGTTIPAQISALSIPAASAIADAVWDEALSGHLSAGSTGTALNAAGSAGAPWSTSLAAILEDTGTTIPAQISALSIPTAVQIRQEVDSNSTQLAAIKAKTDSLTFTVAGQVDANARSVNSTLLTGDGTVDTPWGPAS